MRFIDDFQIRSMQGEILHGSVEELEMLVNFILTRGLSEIAKVSFYIVDDAEPHAFRNVIVRNHVGLFIPEFCDEVHAADDWALVMKVLEYGNLDEMFVKHIHTPQQP